MPDRNRRQIVEVLIIVGVLFLIGLAGWRIYEYAVHQSEQRENYAQNQETQRGGGQVWVCHFRVRTLEFECSEIGNPSSTQSDYTQYDLNAQQDMAIWAYAMALASGVGLIITLAGLVYVARTLAATRETVETTREIGRKQVRAYLSVTGVEFFVGDQDLHPVAIGKVKNSGSSPALGVEALIEVSLYSRDHETHSRFYMYIGIGDLTSGEARDIPGHFNEKVLSLEDWGAGLANLDVVAVSILLQAKDVFGDSSDTFTQWLLGYEDERSPRYKIRPMTRVDGRLPSNMVSDTISDMQRRLGELRTKEANQHNNHTGEYS